MLLSRYSPGPPAVGRVLGVMMRTIEQIVDDIQNITDSELIQLDGSEFVYHYLPADALIGIISAGKLQISNLMYLNDPMEIKYSRDVLISVIEEIVKDKDTKFKDTVNELFKISIIDKLDLLSKRIFVFSTSLNNDNLHLWNY
jgi:hypothetical protein